MPKMKIFNSLEKEAFDSPPMFNSAERKQFFSLPLLIKDSITDLRTPTNKVCFLVVAGYFKARRKFFARQFHQADIEYVARQIDINPEKVIGHISERVGKPVEILHMDRLKEVVKVRNVEIGIITTPPQAAQQVADLLIDANVKGILNLSPATVRTPENIKLRNLFFTSALDNLVYYLTN